MTKIVPVSRERHADLRWQRYSSYNFVATTTVVPLAAAELTLAVSALPLAFIQRNGRWRLAAMLGLLPGKNLFVTANGGWNGSYVPAAFRAHPFVIGTSANGTPILCVDEDTGLVKEGCDGETFFDDAGALSPAISQVLTFLQTTNQSEEALIQACEPLVHAGVVEPWPIVCEGEQGPQQVNDLYRIHEAALNDLDNTAFLSLRRCGSLAVAYAQLLSMNNLTKLGQLAQARAEADAAERAKAEVKPMVMLPLDSTIDWDWSKIGR